MKTPIRLLLPAVGSLLLLAACASPTPPTPQVNYPVIYQIPIGSTRLATADGVQELDVDARQRIEVRPGRPLYYQVLSPVDVTVTVFANFRGRSSSTALAEHTGTSFTTSMTPRSPGLEFVFSVTQPNSSGTLTFTVSDQPIAAAVAPL